MQYKNRAAKAARFFIACESGIGMREHPRTAGRRPSKGTALPALYPSRANRTQRTARGAGADKGCVLLREHFAPHPAALHRLPADSRSTERPPAKHSNRPGDSPGLSRRSAPYRPAKRSNERALLPAQPPYSFHRLPLRSAAHKKAALRRLFCAELWIGCQCPPPESMPLSSAIRRLAASWPSA